MYWRLNRIQYPIYNLGLGKRLGIWVQGCSLKCEGCISQSLWTTKNGKDIEIDLLVNQIAQLQEHFDGITITGGEPFEQYEALVVFSAYIKQKTTLDIYVFSGYTLEELQAKFPDRLFMKYMDYLMDGRYVKELHDNNNFRGSTNQGFYKFDDGRAAQLKSDSFSNNKWSVAVSKNKQIFMAGIPKRDELKMLTEDLNQAGIAIRFK